MAFYQDRNELSYKESPEFAPTFKPGAITPYSGIYICTNCRDEIAANQGNPLPPQNHRQHQNLLKPIEWRLLVRTQTGPPLG